ncbi:MAG: TonB-dependent receptor, partial [Vulcanimicrobiaceae bacterium]
MIGTRQNAWHRVVSAFFLCAFIAVCVAPATAQTTTGTITGIIVDQTTSLAIVHAGVTLQRSGKVLQSTTTDAQGNYSFANVAPGLYEVGVDAHGYGLVRSEIVAVTAGSTVAVRLSLSRVATTGSLKTIATVTSRSGGALAATTTITKSIDAQLLNDEGYLRAAELLHNLPGVNFAGSGQTAAQGDDSYIDIRGLGETETQALLDGHPVGPQGVYGINHPYGTYSGSFNYAAASFLALNKVQVTFGSGASGLYGTDATGGTIDMQTLNPTRKRSMSLIQGIGDQGQQKTAFKATGTIGRLGYALAGGVQGLYGMFPGSQIAQSSRPNNFGINPCPAQPNPDLTSCNLAANTYRVTGDTTLRTGLVKFRYALSGNTDITAAWYGAGQESDSTGNGDGDNIPYDARLGLIQANP